MPLPGSGRLVIDPLWKEILAAHGLDSVQGAYECREGQVVTGSGSSEVRRIELPGATPRTIYLKKYWVDRPRQIWSGLFRGVVLGKSKARREYENLMRFRAWGLKAPAAAAFGEDRRHGIVRRSFLISEGVAAGCALDRTIRDWLPTQPATARHQWRAELIVQLARCTSRLHANRFCHHDYFWRNLILSGGSPSQFWLIDSHKGRIWKAWSGRRGRVKDLATLDAPAPYFFRRTERLRFLLEYLGHDHLQPDDKAFARRILRAAEPLRKRQLERVLQAGLPR
jgi:hypothetical protein